MWSANHSDAFLLRTNKSLCGPVGLRPLPADYQPTETTLPGVTAEEPEQEVSSEDVEDAFQSAEQLGAELVTLSLLPESRWKSLLHLDVIKVSPDDIMQNQQEAPPPQVLAETLINSVKKLNSQLINTVANDQTICLQRRNKPVAPPAAPAAAPFFLPTLPGLTPRFAAPSESEGENKVQLVSLWVSCCTCRSDGDGVMLQSKVLSLGSIAERSEFASALEASLHSGSCEYLKYRFWGQINNLRKSLLFMKLKFNSAVDLPLRLLKDSGPSAISIELTNLAPEGGGSNILLLAFIQMIDSMLASGRDFDLAHGYLALFLKVRTHLSSNFCLCVCV